MTEGRPERGPVYAVQQAHQPRLLFLELERKQVARKHRSDQECCQNRPSQRISIRLSHRSEDLALDSLHREQRNKGGYGNRDGKQDSLIYLERTREESQELFPKRIRHAGKQVRGIALENTERLVVHHPPVDVLNKNDG